MYFRSVATFLTLMITSASFSLSAKETTPLPIRRDSIQQSLEIEVIRQAIADATDLAMKLRSLEREPSCGHLLQIMATHWRYGWDWVHFLFDDIHPQTRFRLPRLRGSLNIELKPSELILHFHTLGISETPPRFGKTNWLPDGWRHESLRPWLGSVIAALAAAVPEMTQRLSKQEYQIQLSTVNEGLRKSLMRLGFESFKMGKTADGLNIYRMNYRGSI